MRKKLFIMDIDGTLAIGENLIPGAAELIEEIRIQGGQCCFFTNNSSRGIREYQEQFRRWGIETSEREFLTAGTFAIHWLKQKFGEQKIYVQGTNAFLQECRREGLHATEEPGTDVAAVLSTYDREMTYEKVMKTCRLLEQGIPWYATNADAGCPCEFGMVPDCAAICEMISRAVGRRPEYLGKPDAGMAAYALERFDCTKEEALVIGDRLYTDIACGENAGIDTCLVLTGEEKEYSGQPTYCLFSVQGLAKILRRMRVAGEWNFPPQAFAANPIDENFPVSNGKSINGIQKAIPGLYDQASRWYKGDLHIHTTCSDGHDTPECLNLRAERNGLDYYAVTDHNYWHETWPLSGCMVIPGMEITMEAGHMNVFGHGPFLLSLNHPYLSKWSWKLPDLVLAAIDCLEIDNNPTFEYEPDVHATEANQRAVRLSDLLWADGYRICAVGGSDVHLKETERYGDSPDPTRPGDPSTYLYMDGLSANGFRDALKSCHAYVTRQCSLDFSCTLYDAEHQKLRGRWLFGDQIPKECCYLEYDLQVYADCRNGIQILQQSSRSEICPDGKNTGNKKETAHFYVLVNGEKHLLSESAETQMENAEHAQWKMRYHGVLTLSDTSYTWIRFGAEDEDGKLVFYANPFTRGTKEQHQYRTFGDVSLSL